MAYQAMFWSKVNICDIATSWSTGVSVNDNKVNLGLNFFPSS